MKLPLNVTTKLHLPSSATAKLMAAAFIVTMTAVNIMPAFAGAAQVTQRSITMSDSGASTGNVASNGSPIGTGTGVTYNLAFTTATAGAIQGIVVSFCDNTPFIQDGTGCSPVTGFVAGTTVGAQTGITGTYGATVSNGGGGGQAGHVLRLTNPSATSTAANTPVSIAVSGFTNPDTSNHTFYARILTYTTDTAANAYTDAAAGSYLDYGAVALSTAQIITITARVQETLIFCVTKSQVTTATCDAANLTPQNQLLNNAPNLVLGHGTNLTLDATQTDTAFAYSQVSTNAVNGVVIRLVNSNKCGGLSRIAYSAQTATTGCDIPAKNNNTGGTVAAGATTMPFGTAAFGVNVVAGDPIAGQSGTLSPSPVYNDTAAPTDPSKYGMNTTNDTTNGHPGVSSTYGDPVASSTGPLNSINTKYTFAATASNITPSGIYTANIALVATGTY